MTDTLRKLSSIAFSIFLTGLFSVFFLEVYYRYYGKNYEDLKINLKRDTESRDKNFLLQNSNQPIFYKIYGENGIILKDVRLDYDSFGRRQSIVQSNPQKFAIFLGCSYVFGSGLNANETLEYFFSKETDMQVFNYGRGGASPTTSLLQIESLDFKNQIPEDITTGEAFYFLYDFQWRRILASYAWVAKHGFMTPIYSLNPDNQQVVFRGLYNEAYPLKSKMISWIRHLHFTHYLFDFNRSPDGETDQKFICSIFNKSFEILKAKLEGRVKKFNIVAPIFTNQLSWEDFLNNIRTCLNPDVELHVLHFEGSLDNYVIDKYYEYHPNAQYNNLLVKKILQIQK